MSTDFISAELVDYLNNELAPNRRKEIEDLLDTNPERAREFEEFKQAQQAVRQLKVKDASGDFNAKVQNRIQKKIEELRARGSTRFRTARQRVDAAREGLSAEEIKRRSGKAAKLFLIALLATLPVLGLGLLGGYCYFEERARLRKISEDRRRTLLEGLALRERQKARATGKVLAVAADGQVSGLGFAGNKKFHLVLFARQKSGERCVFVYDPEQWKNYLAVIEKRRGLRGYKALAAAAQQAREVKAKDDVLQLPPAVYQEFLRAPARIQTLMLVGRAEIWSTDDFGEYMKRAPKPAPKRRPRMRWVPE
jgi:hypothetical protein